MGALERNNKEKDNTLCLYRITEINNGLSPLSSGTNTLIRFLKARNASRNNYKTIRDLKEVP